jgi:membrane dipeptidase
MMMTLTWNDANEICGGCGVGGKFTPFGKQVDARMEALNMSVDVSHIADESFWELCEFAEKPFCASHSNARGICDHRRNLTDGMFREIARRGGVVGLNYYTHFIKDGGETESIEDLLRHLYRFLELGGEDNVALGSDFDGADLPPYLCGIEKLGGLKEEIIRFGISEGVADKVLYGNAYRYLTSFAGQP